MRVLLDECLPRGLKKHLHEHDVKTVPEAGWAGLKNGELLRVASGNVDVFVTIDSNLAYQQTVTGFSFRSGRSRRAQQPARRSDPTGCGHLDRFAFRWTRTGVASRWLTTRCSGPGCARPLNAIIVGQTCGKDRECLTSRRSRGGTPGFLVKRRLSMARLWSIITSCSRGFPAKPTGSRTRSRFSPTILVVHGRIQVDGWSVTFRRLLWITSTGRSFPRSVPKRGSSVVA